MSRYIDADKMLEACTKYIASVFPKSYEFAKQDAELLIATEPTIDLVRCKECRYWQNKHLCATWSAFGTIETDADDFCSYGERKESE